MAMRREVPAPGTPDAPATVRRSNVAAWQWVMGRLSKARKARQRYEGRSCHTAGCYVCRSTLVGLRYHRSPVGDMHVSCALRIKSELKRELSRW